MKLRFVTLCILWGSSYSFQLKSSIKFRSISPTSPIMSLSNQKNEFSPFSSFEMFSEEEPMNTFQNKNNNEDVEHHFEMLSFLPLLLSMAGMMMMFTNPLSAVAENLSFDPALFQPVCHFSDVVYQFLKSAVGMFYIILYYLLFCSN